jgi:catechol 2,3-dioxygenase-like lactoylglutathione lyase family enzyme
MTIDPPPQSKNEYLLAESGSPLYAATIGVEDLDRSVGFFRDSMGFDVMGRQPLSGSAFETHWGLPQGARAEMAVLADRGCEVGRVALVRFEANRRERVRNIEGQRFFGLVNLNFYTEDIFSHTATFEAAGCRAWSTPIVHPMGNNIGEPVEVMLDGPDSVILNLIELRASSPTARILRTVAYIQDHGGYNRCGTTPVATSQHCVSDYERAMQFNTRVLGQSVRNDTVLSGPAMEQFMRYPPSARSRDTYLQGTHVFGKIAINHPLNFECTNLVPRAVPPNFGYLAQSFVVSDLAAAITTAKSIGAEAATAPVEIELPGLGRVATAMLRNPGSGALHELIERIG